MVFVALSLPIHADVMSTPGAKKSTAMPKFEKGALVSALSMAPMVSASLTRAGDAVSAFALLLPAAMV